MESFCYKYLVLGLLNLVLTIEGTLDHQSGEKLPPIADIAGRNKVTAD